MVIITYNFIFSFSLGQDYNPTRSYREKEQFSIWGNKPRLKFQLRAAIKENGRVERGRVGMPNRYQSSGKQE